MMRIAQLVAATLAICGFVAWIAWRLTPPI